MKTRRICVCVAVAVLLVTFGFIGGKIYGTASNTDIVLAGSMQVNNDLQTSVGRSAVFDSMTGHYVASDVQTFGITAAGTNNIAVIASHSNVGWTMFEGVFTNTDDSVVISNITIRVKAGQFAGPMLMAGGTPTAYSSAIGAGASSNGNVKTSIFSQ